MANNISIGRTLQNEICKRKVNEQISDTVIAYLKKTKQKKNDLHRIFRLKNPVYRFDAADPDILTIIFNIN